MDLLWVVLFPGPSTYLSADMNKYDNPRSITAIYIVTSSIWSFNTTSADEEEDNRSVKMSKQAICSNPTIHPVTWTNLPSCDHQPPRPDKI